MNDYHDPLTPPTPEQPQRSQFEHQKYKPSLLWSPRVIAVIVLVVVYLITGFVVAGTVSCVAHGLVWQSQVHTS